MYKEHKGYSKERAVQILLKYGLWSLGVLEPCKKFAVCAYLGMNSA